MVELWQLKQRQLLPLQAKIQRSKRLIRSWYEYFDGDVYVSFSGGKDSTVLLHLVRSIYKNIPAIFINTGLEYPEIIRFVRTIDNVTWLKPKMNFKKVIEKYGYPVVSKEVSMMLRQIRTLSPDSKSYKLRMTGINSKGKKSNLGKLPNKWRFLINAPFKISEQCCYMLKKKPIREYEKLTNNKVFLGIKTEDSNMRTMQYIRKGGCNAFYSQRPQSNPLSFWLEDDIWNYLKLYNVPYSKIYDMGYERTGCMFCMFGVHLEKYPNRFQLMEKIHPKLYEYCMKKLKLQDVLKFVKNKGQLTLC